MRPKKAKKKAAFDLMPPEKQLGSKLQSKNLQAIGFTVNMSVHDDT